MNPDTKAMIEAGERRLRERRSAPQPDPMVELLNRITEDRDRWKAIAGRYVIEAAENNEQIARLVREQRSLRVIVQTQQLLLDHSEPARVVYAQAEGATQ